MVNDNEGSRHPSPTSLSGEAELQELREALASRDAFLALVAHELRNPMTPILAQVQRLRRMAQDGSDAEILARGAERAERLVVHYIKRVTTLLDVTRIRAGRVDLKPEPHDFAETAGQVVESLGPAAAYSGCRIEFSCPETLPAVFDRLAGEQILENLLSNAIKYAPGQPILVFARIDGEDLAFGVSDRGPGISPHDQQRIFERFERLLGAGAPAGGFGVGLWVVRRLVEAMHGRITVSSVEGQGSTFTVRLPRSGAGADDQRRRGET
ncbi:sensor histidine kinase [Alsobacter soli]|uniref:histidine kinase n=1 Tax=Alsobacter soli TaxID=2109933 RepID=A0A2T1HTZ9_9HYPH|nr:sensor histidine kinase [Alsobacter soli]